MTIGIAACGPGAGLAVVRALAAVEKVGRGAIGGFASFVAFDRAGRLWRAETQRGGTGTLFIAGETTGGDPPDEIAEAPWAAVMSSGPDRPSPLAQFTPADPAVGLLTGHRLPNGAGPDGRPLNLAVLDRMRAGAPPDEAIRAVLERAPAADAGIIALDRANRLVAMNTPHVERRDDLGRCVAHDPETGAGVAVLHNAIYPSGPLAALAAGVALDVMAPADRIDLWATLGAGTPLIAAGYDAVRLGADERIEAVLVSDAALLRGRIGRAVIGWRTTVERDGRVIGVTTSEPYALVEDGRVVSLSGQAEVPIGIQLLRS